MVPSAVHSEQKEGLNRRLEAVGWGLFLIIMGALWLMPEGTAPQGVWLIAAGIIMLGVNAVRYVNGIQMSGGSLLLGLLAVIFGVGEFVGMDLPFVAILVIVFGAGIILRPWLDPLLERRSS